MIQTDSRQMFKSQSTKVLGHIPHEYDRTGQLSADEILFLERIEKLVQEMKETDLYLAEVRAKCVQARKEI